MATTPQVVRELVEFADNRGFGPFTLGRLIRAVSGPGHLLSSTTSALEAASILRRLDDGTLDIATLLDEPCTNLDAAREQYVAQYEAQLDAACRALAGDT